MNANVEKELLKQFEKGYENTYRNGLLRGATAVSKVVLDKAKNTTKTLEERIDEIIKFCEVSLKN